MRSGSIQPGDRSYSRAALLCAACPVATPSSALGIGYGMTRGPSAVPRDARAAHVQPGLAARCSPDEGLLRHRHDETQVLHRQVGSLAGHAQHGDEARRSSSARQDTFSVPAGQLAHGPAASRPGRTRRRAAPASCSSSTAATAGCDLEWAPEVVEAAFDARLDARPERLPRSGRGDGHGHRGRLTRSLSVADPASASRCSSSAGSTCCHRRCRTRVGRCERGAVTGLPVAGLRSPGLASRGRRHGVGVTGLGRGCRA